MDCPLLVWMLSLNREVTLDEYNQCFELVRTCAPHAKIKHDPNNSDTFRQLVSQMMPLLMMRHRRVPRAKWKDNATPLGKHWIEQDAEGMHPDRWLRSMIGYSLTYETSLVGMAMVQGRQRDVINVGIGIKQLAVEPPGVTVRAYAESLSHKLTQLELSFISPDLTDEVILRRLCILLAVKQAYIRAIGQPIGFDWSRLEFNIPEESAMGDGTPLQGWEFRVFKANLGIVRKGVLLEESHQCVSAFFRGTRESKFIWHDNTKDLESWVQFINIDQMIKVIPKLTA
ncbi:hypothetical protein JAAARDRAFT_36818 [Jaapia argillacea MUCL 33604]|uniref:holo-[acyl-carrier-protein] synthase n=1 Tax=Jaapia argillacea MUCL 33604 TaxID=933084 RepID=A0A067PXM9_9AGAM|nr:hypothetical protein JAAARDRAFT_36818 [Jaapia argillacea MUCL 33604]